MAIWLLFLIVESAYRALLEVLQARRTRHLPQGFIGHQALLAVWFFTLSLHGTPVWVLAIVLCVVELILPSPLRETHLPSTLPHVRLHEDAHQTLRHGRKRRWTLLALIIPLILFPIHILSWTPLLLFTIRSAVFWIRPIINGYCWQQEFAADREAASRCGIHHAKQALELLQQGSADPHPWFALHHSTHPSARMRLAHLEG